MFHVRAVLAVAVICLLAAGIGAGAPDDSVAADPATPGANATHLVSLTVEPEGADSVSGLAVDYGDPSVGSAAIDQSAIVAFGIDRGDDAPGADVDEDLRLGIGQVLSLEEGRRVNVGLNEREPIEPGDEVVFAYRTVNPSEGNYSVTVDLNPTIDGDRTTAPLRIGGRAEVRLGDQRSDGSSVVVRSAFLPVGGSVVVHRANETVVRRNVTGNGTANGTTPNATANGTTPNATANGTVATITRLRPGAVIGRSAALPPGTSRNVPVDLDENLTASTTLIAVAHRPPNRSANGSILDPSVPYTAPAVNGTRNVSDDATASVATPTATPTATETTAAGPTRTPAATESSGGLAPGFGPVATVIAVLLGLLAIRRRD